MNKENCGVYKITNSTNNKYYIGSSSNIKNRIRKHFEMLKRNSHHSIYLQRAYNKHGGDCFITETLETCEISNLLNIEQYYFDKITDWKNCYNICRIARGGGCDLSVHPNGNKIRRKMSVSNKGKHTKPFIINNVYYKTLLDAAEVYNVDIKAISYRIKNWDYKDYFYIGFPKIGEFNENFHEKYWYKPQKQHKKYYCKCGCEITKDGKYCLECRKARRDCYKYDNTVIINGIEYDTPKEASRALNIEYATLLWRINTNTLTFKDYWYKNSPKDKSKLITVDDINKRISEKNIGNIGSRNKRPFTVDNIKYLTLGEASLKLGIRKQLIWDRLKSNNFENYKYV